MILRNGSGDTVIQVRKSCEGEIQPRTCQKKSKRMDTATSSRAS
jgi:hypothetical protein